MAKKIEVDIEYLKNIGLSQKQISEIIKNSEPDHWTNKLPQDDLCFELNVIVINPDVKHMTVMFDETNPLYSFFDNHDAIFIQKKCLLLIEMSNFSFAVNENWCPDWNDKDEKKYGIVLQNGQARVSENELFNLYVFGIVLKTRSLALEMLEEFKERIELLFNKPFNSTRTISLFKEGTIGVDGHIGIDGTTNTELQNKITGHNQITNEVPIIIDFLAPRYENATSRKKRKSVVHTDIAIIQDMILKGVHQKEIAEKLGYSQGTISRVKERIGLAMRKRKS
jgi:hypothetical protein